MNDLPPADGDATGRHDDGPFDSTPGGDPRDPGRAKTTPDDDVRGCGMKLFLAALSAFFLASIVGYLLIFWFLRTRGPAEDYGFGVEAPPPPPDLPGLPSILLLSTTVMLASSVTIHLARAAIARGRHAGLKAWMLVTMLLGLAFLGLQIVAWFQWGDAAAHVLFDDAYRAYRFMAWGFVVLSILHALHVVGGLVPMTVVFVKAWRERYSASNHVGVRELARYWHFLDVVWIVMLAVLFVAT